jgi:hypothetical protein
MPKNNNIDPCKMQEALRVSVSCIRIIFSFRLRVFV